MLEAGALVEEPPVCTAPTVVSQLGLHRELPSQIEAMSLI